MMRILMVISYVVSAMNMYLIRLVVILMMLAMMVLTEEVIWMSMDVAMVVIAMMTRIMPSKDSDESGGAYDILYDGDESCDYEVGDSDDANSDDDGNGDDDDSNHSEDKDETCGDCEEGRENVF
jgi:hypothetical protein